MKTIAIVGTLDSKGPEHQFLKEVIEAAGVSTLMVDTGVFPSTIPVDISNVEVAKAAGATLEELVAKKDRALATKTMAQGMEKLLPALYEQGKFDGVISLGGSGGTALATAGMRALPIGVPKIMVSTMAGGNVSPYVGLSDIMMYPSIVDVSGLNSISLRIFTNAALALVGMVTLESPVEVLEKPHIAATMFGVTTPSVDAAREYLTDKGYEVLVFHATGAGGKAMEHLIEEGFFQGVLDLTTTEWNDELFGGALAAGKHRLEAAGKHGVPQVVSVGALDMVNFGPYDTVPQQYTERKLYRHNPTVTLMRTTVEENRQVGQVIAEKLNKTTGPTALFLPLEGVSMLDAKEQPFYGPEEDTALFDTLQEGVDSSKVEIITMENNINDKEFAQAAAKKLMQMIEQKNSKED